MRQGTRRRFRSLRINMLEMPGSLVASYLTFPPAAPNIRLIHPPAAPDRALAAVERRFELGTVFQDPPVDGGVIDGYPALLHEFFHLTVAQGIGQIPPHARQDHVSHKVGPLEADHDRSLARVVSRRISGTDHRRNDEQRKFATEPPPKRLSTRRRPDLEQGVEGRCSETH